MAAALVAAGTPHWLGPEVSGRTLDRRMLGVGTTSSTVSALWAATANDVAAAMTVTADPGTWQTLFDRWITGLGLPLRNDLAVFAVSAVRGADGATTALLLD